MKCPHCSRLIDVSETTDATSHDIAELARYAYQVLKTFRDRCDDPDDSDVIHTDRCLRAIEDLHLFMQGCPRISTEHKPTWLP